MKVVIDMVWWCLEYEINQETQGYSINDRRILTPFTEKWNNDPDFVCKRRID